MREVFTSQSSTLVGYYKSVLDDALIASYIKNDITNNPSLAGAAFFPSLCVIDDEDYDEALRILKSHQTGAATETAEWTCPACSEKNPPNFELCWNCQTTRPV